MTAPVPTALLFPGQGAQRSGMGEPWRMCASWQLTREISETAGVDVEELLLKADDEALRRTDLAQLAVFTADVIALHEARATGGLGTVCGYAGHSLGEYVALYAAGALSLGDAARVVAARGRAMRQAAQDTPGTMAVLVRADADTVEALVLAVREEGHDVWLANLNAPGQIVVSGSLDGIERAAGIAGDYDAKVMRVPVGGAFHTPLMAAAVEPLTRALAAVPFAATHEPVVANVDARVHTGADTDWRALQVRQLTHPVLWERGVHTLHGGLGCLRFVELGPGRALSGMVKRTVKDAVVVTVNTPDHLPSPVA
ncbi:ACP S-malonyltransferase [Streptomyces chumphonensis]|uniref:Malonyl CoA-acyl carrier protein transacylase n=1 Tax=Streptomyces chumphonensis TaxID=1214925 RepID=A0A927F3Y9_9ACTN|nr:ACP S-malonyltransferase [Streptomyces chumphonensis]MBD3934565.1 ACP S-malonyltransferase [Streptomyces chumphonensis]